MADGNEYNVFLLRESGVPIEPVYAPEGTPLVVGNAAILKNAPDPTAARLFYHFMFSREAQQLNSDLGGLRSFHRDVTPRPDMVAIRADATFAELRALFREQEYSRIPVYNENLDNIVGFVFVKDLIRLSGSESANARLQPDLARLIRPATFVPETKRVSEMLKEFQRKQVQVAIVVDEYGGTAGMVSIEDLLEEIVGEIRDEYDVETEPIVDEGKGTFVFSAKVNIDELRECLGVTIEPEGFETVGGYELTR